MQTKPPYIGLHRCISFFLPPSFPSLSPFQERGEKILYISHTYISLHTYMYIYNFRFPSCDIYSTSHDTAENSWISRSPEPANPLLISLSSRRPPLLPYRSGPAAEFFFRSVFPFLPVKQALSSLHRSSLPEDIQRTSSGCSSGGPYTNGDGERGEPDGAVGGGPWPAMATATAGHELLRAVPAAPGAEQERVQPLLPRLHRRSALRLLPPGAPRPSRRPDTAVVVPQRDPGVGGGEADRHLARADVRDQQRQDRVPQRPAAGQARQGRHQHLRDLLPEPPRLVPLLLPRLQAGRDAVGPEPDVRHPAEARAGLRRWVRLRRLVQPQEAPEDGRVRPGPLRPGRHPVVGRRRQQVQQWQADHAGDAADQPLPAVQEEGHPSPCPFLRLASRPRWWPFTLLS